MLGGYAMWLTTPGAVTYVLRTWRQSPHDPTAILALTVAVLEAVAFATQLGFAVLFLCR